MLDVCHCPAPLQAHRLDQINPAVDAAPVGRSRSSGGPDDVGASEAASVLPWPGGGISQVNLDGTEERSIVGEAAATGFFLTDLKVDATRVYWSDSGFHQIGAVSLDGQTVNNSLVPLRFPGLNAAPTALAVQDGYIYFSWSPRTGGNGRNDGAAAIGRADSDGRNILLEFIRTPSLSPFLGGGAGRGGITSLAVDGGYIYWMDARSRHIGRAKLDGSDVQKEFIKTSAPSEGSRPRIALSSQHVFCTDGFVGRAARDGTEHPAGISSPPRRQRSHRYQR